MSYLFFVVFLTGAFLAAAFFSMTGFGFGFGRTAPHAGQKSRLSNPSSGWLHAVHRFIVVS